MMAKQATIWVIRYPNANSSIPPFNNQNNNTLWDWSIATFQAAWTDTAWSEEALTKLLAIKMQGGDLDIYIATFNHLYAAMEQKQDSRGMIFLF